VFALIEMSPSHLARGLVIYIYFCLLLLQTVWAKEGTGKSQQIQSSLPQARDMILSNKPQSALSLLDSIPVEQKHDSAEYYFLLGRALQDLKRNTDSLSAYSVAIYIDALSVKSYINRGLVRGALQDLDGALTDLNKAIELSPRNARAYLNRAVTFAGKGDIPKAMNDFDQAIQIDSRYAEAFRNRGITKNHLGNQRGACADWFYAARLGDAETRQWVSLFCTKRTRLVDGPLRAGQR
jgi:tetratricopeptide (TPR) repeat protein